MTEKTVKNAQSRNRMASSARETKDNKALEVPKKRGGARPGAGRKPGKLVAKRQTVAEKLYKLKHMPVEEIVEIAKECKREGDRAGWFACEKELMKYVYPTLQAQRVETETTGKIEISWLQPIETKGK